MRLTITELEVLAGLAEGKTLTEIGEQLAIQQPAVSKALRLAELRLGLPLVVRQQRRLRLTPLGADIARRAHAAVEHLRELDQFVREAASGQTGPLRILAAQTPGTYILPRVVFEFLKRYPAVETELRIERLADLWRVFIDEEFDVCIGPVGLRWDLVLEKGWPIERLYDDQITFFAAPTSRLAAEECVRWEDLTRETVIGPLASSLDPYWEQMWQSLTRHGFSPSRLMKVRGTEAVKLLVEDGEGVGVLFGAALQRDFSARRLVRLVVEDAAVIAPYCLVQRPSYCPPPAIDLFREILTASVARLQPALLTGLPEHTT